MKGGQSSNQLPSENKRCPQGHLGAPNTVQRGGSGYPYDDPFPFPVAKKMTK